MSDEPTTAYRVTWFGGDRPVDGAAVYLKPPTTETVDDDTTGAGAVPGS